ncbi:MAG: hypothetical protein QM765_27155 [Myxococcales bacterium]
MAKREPRTVAKKSKGAAGRPLTKSDFDQVMAKVFERFERVDKRFEQVDKRFEQVDKRFEQVDKRFEKVETQIRDEIRSQTVRLEDIWSQNRAAGEQVAAEQRARQRDIQSLRDEILPRVEVIEGVVREHSALLRDKSIEQRVEALEAASKR